MTKIMLNGVSDVPLNKLVLSQANVRRIKAGVSVEDLAEDIAQRGLIQSLAVRPMLDGEGQETGMYEVPAGGRRFEALNLLAKQKRLPKTVRVPCIVRTVSRLLERGAAAASGRTRRPPGLAQTRPARRRLRSGD